MHSMNEELNRKLALWAGWTIGNNTGITHYYINPDGDAEDIPNFVESLDACFKWLVPMVIDKIMAKEGDSSVAYAILFKRWLYELALIIPDATLALCLAIGKLIGKEDNQ